MSRFGSSLDEDEELSDAPEPELPDDELETGLEEDELPEEELEDGFEEEELPEEGFEEEELLDVTVDEVGLELEDEEELGVPKVSLGLLVSEEGEEITFPVSKSISTAFSSILSTEISSTP